MPDSLDLSVDWSAADAEAQRIVKRYQDAGVVTIDTMTKQLERRLESATQASVPGNLWRAWASKSYANDGTDPAGIVFIKGRDRSRGAMTSWATAGINKPANGGYEAIPLPAAGAQGRDRNLTPAAWEARTGIQLRPVFRPGKAPLLVADMARLSGRGVARGATARQIASGRGVTTVPIFVLIPFQRFRNAFAIGPLVAQTTSELPGEFSNAVGSA